MPHFGQYLPNWFTVPRRGRTYVYVRPTRGPGSETPAWLRALLFLIFGGLASFVIAQVERTLFEKNVFYPIIARSVVELAPGQSAAGLDGDLVHLNARDLAAPDPPVDPLFRIGAFDNSVRLKRNVEFCEWREFSTEHCHKEGQGDNERQVCERTYYYVKDWHPSRQTSILFDQPFGHNNPSRPDLMGLLQQSGGDHDGRAIFDAPDVFAAHAGAKDGLIKLDSRFVRNFDWFRRVTPDPSMLSEFQSSPIASRDSESFFKYIGGGYFLSPYSPSGFSQFLRGLGMLWDQSLLDFQIADLFSKCTAGDVRVSFETVDAAPVALIGRVFENARLDPINPAWLLATHGRNTSFVHSNEPIVIARKGSYTSSALLKADLSSSVWFSRGVKLAFALFCVFYLRSHTPTPDWIPSMAASFFYTLFSFFVLKMVYGTVGTGGRGQWTAWMGTMAALGTWMWRVAPSFAGVAVGERVVEGKTE